MNLTLYSSHYLLFNLPDSAYLYRDQSSLSYETAPPLHSSLPPLILCVIVSPPHTSIPPSITPSPSPVTHIGMDSGEGGKHD